MSPLLSATDIAGIISAVGENVTYTPFGGAGVTIKVRFDLDNVQINPLTGEQQLFNVRCTANQADVPSLKNKDTILKDSVTYEVIDFAKDEQGNFVLIELKKA